MIDSTGCLVTLPIIWNCNCTGKTGATPVTVHVGGVDYQGCTYNDPEKLCLPTAPKTGDMTIIYPPESPGDKCVKWSGAILTDGTDYAFCLKTPATEVDCPQVNIGN